MEREEALRDGVEHRDVREKPLATALEIVEAFQRDGSIQFRLPPGAAAPKYD